MKRLLLLFLSILTGLVLITCSDSGTGPDPGNGGGNEETPTYDVNVSVTPSDAGGIAPSAAETFEEGEEIELQAEPNEGYLFTGWSGDVESSDNPLSLTVDQDYSLTAEFEVKTYELTIHKEGEGAVDEEILEEKSKEYEHGTVVELTANPAEGYRFVEWTGDITGADNPAQITVDTPKEVTAVFERKSYSLTVDTEGKGAVQEELVQEKLKEYEHGAVVQLTADPAEGWKFSEWKGATHTSENPIDITVDSPKEVIAVFEEEASSDFYLAENGVTVKCPVAEVGDTGTVNGIVYTKRSYGQITASNAETTCTSGVTKLRYVFNGASTFDQDISSWDVSYVEDMVGLFNDASSFNGDLSNWDVSSVTNMKFTFAGAQSFNKDLNSWDVSSVTNMEGMFDGAGSFNQDLNSWNVGNVTTLRHIFRSATSFNGDVSSWDVSSVTDMSGVFSQAASFNREINNWEVSNVTMMDYMFTSASSFNQSLDSWDVSNVVAMDGMFQRATSFNGDIRSWNVGNVERMEHMFDEAESFNRNISSWDVSSVVNMDDMFNGAEIFSQDLSGWCVSNIDSHPNYFNAGTDMDYGDVPEWGTCP